VEELDNCIVEFKGLKQGEHLFKLNLSNEFLSDQEISDILDLNLYVEISLTKRERFLEASIKISGNATVKCDRCLENLVLEIENSAQLIVKIEEDEVDSTDREDIITVAQNENKVDFTQIVYELLMLSIPLKKVHGEDSEGYSLCNEEMLAYISEEEVEDEIDAEKKDIDPRWEGLRNINFNDN